MHEHRVSDLLITALNQQGLDSGLYYPEPQIEGVRVNCENEDAYLLITDINGTGISYPMGEHGGLLVNRYERGDLTQWREVYATTCSEAFTDVKAGAAVIAAEVREGDKRAASWPLDLTSASEPGGRRTVWVLRRWDRHDDVISLWTSEAKAKECLAGYVIGLWEDVSWREGVPDEPPSGVQETLDFYYGPQDGWDEEGYTIFSEEFDEGL